MAADHQRIHPVVVDPEAPPRTPPGSILRSEKVEPGGRGQHQIPLRRNVAFPAVPPPPPLPPPPIKKRSCLCKCICWTITLLILLLFILGAIIGILYLVFQPKLPKYSVDNLRITDLTLNFDLSLYARFNVKITAYNPNKNIGIYYEKGSHLSEQQQTGRIPLDLKINEPVSVKLKTLKLMKVKIVGTCKLIVDSLSTNRIISIKARTCNFGVKL
ncbi:Hypothetical predicted protein [Olea europaea subsp. europaea]|uniref:Late embryogenesis abundant protein LEA-2 subgroup domain-containing protein n=1 Tax=Olea europaea subsp. europaea TaxID=158383 RepID=A0A8S0TUL1_OLEEU|nr:Hypothetical predicted protein [Olea europaea subsp. europaea]